MLLLELELLIQQEEELLFSSFLLFQMKVVHVLKPSRRRKRSTRKNFLKHYSSPVVLTKELTGGFLPALIPIIAAAISAAPAIAGTVIAAQNAKRS